MNIITMLKQDHKKVKDILKQLNNTTSKAAKTRQKLFATLVENLTPHEKFEEKHLYPDLIQTKKSKEKVLEAYEEHHVADLIIEELKKTPFNSEIWKAKLAVLKENLEHHIREEEEILFPFANKTLSKTELAEIGAEYQAKKDQLGLK